VRELTVNSEVAGLREQRAGQQRAEDVTRHQDVHRPERVVRADGEDGRLDAGDESLSNVTRNDRRFREHAEAD